MPRDITSGLTRTLPLLAALTLVVESSAIRDVDKTSSSRSASVSAEFHMDYYVPEELPVGTLVGNVIVDFGLDLKYEPEIVERLRFYFLQPTAVHAWQRHAHPSEEPEVVTVVRRHHLTSQLQGHHDTESNDGSLSTASFGSELFTIDERAGVIRSRSRIDREQVCLTSSPVAATALRLSVHGVCIFKLDVAVVLAIDAENTNDNERSASRAKVKQRFA